MADTEDGDQRIHVGETVDGDDLSFPIVEVLTGRAFVTGKSGSGKSNTTSVVVEELLEAGYPVLIVDTDGEYYGLKEEYELLHAGADEECDIQVGTEHAEKLAHLALEENVPIILDVSGYLDDDEADELLRETVRSVFVKEKKLKKPFLLVVEECHEYIPEGGGIGETGNLLIKVGKRGRKHGLGIVGISQRPADVKKDFITQANWLVWHRLTWENDTNVVRRIVGSDYADDVVDLGDGEAFVQTDWSDDAVERVQFKRKRTFDAGATPGLGDFERPDLKDVSGSLTEDLDEISSRKEQERDRIAELENRIENREERIAELESQLETARDVSAAARKMANALAGGDGSSPDGSPPDGYEATLQAKNDQIDRLESRVEDLEKRVHAPTSDPSAAGLADASGRDDATQGDSDAGTTVDGADATASTSDTAGTERGTGTQFDDESTGPNDELTDIAGTEGETSDTAVEDATGSESTGDDSDGDLRAGESDVGDFALGENKDDKPRDALVDAVQDRLRRRGERLQLRDGDPNPEAVVDLLQAAPVVTRVNAARRDSRCNDDAAWSVVSELATTPGATAHDLADAANVDVEAVSTLLSELRARELVFRQDHEYAFNPDRLRELVERDDPSKPRTELRDQWQP